MSLIAVRIDVVGADAGFLLQGTMESEQAPQSTTWLKNSFPLERDLLHARWSGEAAWAPLGDKIYLPPENTISYPCAGQILLYAGTTSEPELLMPYGACSFACRAGPLAGNHVITLNDGRENLALIGLHLLWHGSLRVVLDFD